MRTKDVERLAKIYLLPHLPGFIFHKKLLYISPIEQILRGVFFDSSAYERWTFVIEAFVQPLYIPEEHCHFTFGGRLGNLGGGAENWWTIDETNEEQVMKDVLHALQSEALPFLQSVKSPNDFAKKYEREARDPGIHYMEAVSYSLVIAGKYRKAMKILNRNLKALDKAVKSEYAAPYMQEMADRTIIIKNALIEDPNRTIDILNGWREETLKNLGLENQY
jgi:hypothetical protein